MKDLMINYYRVEKAISYLIANFQSQPSLDEVAEKVNMSPFHFQRIFLDWVGLTPKKFLQYLSVEHLKTKISQTHNVMEAAGLAGLSSQSRVYDLFVKIEGVSPQQYKTGGEGLTIYYGYHASPFGMCFIAGSDRGICDIHFINEERTRDEFIKFSNKWHFASLVHKPDYTQAFIQRIFKEGSGIQDELNVIVQASDFQIKVWQALVNIPFGNVRSYEQIANDIGNPNSMRAVATAAGQNPIMYLIPCHRIIRKDGTVGDFHLGKVLKRTIIAWEMASIAI